MVAERAGRSPIAGPPMMPSLNSHRRMVMGTGFQPVVPKLP